ncbi:hypothetical protein BH11PSE8_BH11PSE8_15380 [soil metagenome]
MKNILLAAVLATSFGAANAALVNGSFDDQVQSAGSWNVYQTVPGWTTTSGSGIEVRNSVAGNSYDGSNYVELDAYSNSSMSQTVTTTAGALYTLSFAYSAREGVSYESNPIQALWNGNAVANVSGDGAGQSGNMWNVYSYNVIGTGHDTLTFAALGTSDTLGGSLDAVSLTAAVPEPSTWALMLGGVGLIGFSLRRRTAR